MANKGLSMRKVREVLRLHYAAGLSTRAIARSLKVSPATVGKYIRRAEVQSLSWPLPEPLDDAALERRLFPAPVLSATQRPLPEWSEVHRELRQKDVTLALLRGRSRRVRPHLVLEGPIANRRAATVGVEPQRGGQHGELRGAQCAYRDQGAVGSEPGAHRAHLGDASLELLGEQADDEDQDGMDQPHPALDGSSVSRPGARPGRGATHWPPRSHSQPARHAPPPLRAYRVHRATVQPDSPAAG